MEQKQRDSATGKMRIHSCILADSYNNDTPFRVRQHDQDTLEVFSMMQCRAATSLSPPPLSPAHSASVSGKKSKVSHKIASFSGAYPETLPGLHCLHLNNALIICQVGSGSDTNDTAIIMSAVQYRRASLQFARQ